MSSMTAQLVVGHADMYHGGIRPTHVAWLSENSRPGWVLQPVERDLYGQPTSEFEDEEPPSWTEDRIVWVPSGPEHVLEDGILLIGVHVLCDEAVLELARERVPQLLEGDRQDLTKLPGDAVAELRERLLVSELNYKLLVTVLGGSTLEEQLPVLERYPMEVEVCTVGYSRLRGTWSSDVQVRGSLTASWSSAGPTPHRYRELNLTSTLPGALAERGDPYPPDEVAAVEEADTLIVAARDAVEEFERTGAYICQPGRSFRGNSKYLGFYGHRRIEPFFPRILAFIPDLPFTPESVADLRASGEPTEARAAAIIEGELNNPNSRRMAGEHYQIVVLDREAGFELEREILHEGGAAWLRKQRYTRSEALKNQPETTEELRAAGG